VIANDSRLQGPPDHNRDSSASENAVRHFPQMQRSSKASRIVSTFRALPRKGSRQAPSIDLLEVSLERAAAFADKGKLA
jgi:hypothetical protein